MTPDQDRDEIVDYIASMLSQLQLMAKASNMELLTYLIGMAHLEAAKGMRTGASGADDERNSAA